MIKYVAMIAVLVVGCHREDDASNDADMSPSNTPGNTLKVHGPYVDMSSGNHNLLTPHHYGTADMSSGDSCDLGSNSSADMATSSSGDMTVVASNDMTTTSTDGSTVSNNDGGSNSCSCSCDGDTVKIDINLVGVVGASVSVDGVVLTVNSWSVKTDDPGQYYGFTFTTTGSYTSLSYVVKGGTDLFDGSSLSWTNPYGVSGPLVHGISHIVFCVVK